MIESTGTRIARSHGEIVGIRREGALQQSLENACVIANVCDSFRGKDTVVLDVSQQTPLFDFFVICTGSSRRQLRAIAETADDEMVKRRTERLGREGDDAPWICHDYGDIVLHVFTPEGRSLYDLEGLWGDAQRVDWQAKLETMTAAPVG